MKSYFEWDDKKNAENRFKHGISFFEAQQAFQDPKRIIAEDLDHSADELRYYCFGRVLDGIMTVRFTYLGHKIRIIGAGYWRKWKKIYENTRN